MLSVLEIYDITWLIPAGLRAADVETQQLILIAVAQFPQHLSLEHCSPFGSSETGL